MGSPGSDPLDPTAKLLLLHFDCSQETGLQHQSTIRPLPASLNLLFTVAVVIIVTVTVLHLIFAASLDLLFNLLVHYYT